MSHLAYDTSPFDIEVVETKDYYVYTADGKRYLDLFMGWNVGNFGWDNQPVKQQSKQPKKIDYVYPRFKYQGWEDLATLLAELTPGNLSKCYRTTGGTESVDAALQIAMTYTGRKKFAAINGSYHGNSLATLSVGGNTDDSGHMQALKDCHKIELPLNMERIEEIEQLLKSEEFAAFVMEPVIFNLGVVIPETEFMQALRKICTQYGTLLILDEVACGFGSTGKLFASEHFDVVPDIMTLSKSISGGYGALGTTITTKEIADAVKDDIHLYSTYGWHPAAVEAGIANLEYIKANKNKIFDNVANLHHLFKNRLENMPFSKPVKLRMIGMAFGIDCGDNEEYAQNILDTCRDNQLLINTQGNVICIFPALTIDEETATLGMDILEDCVKQVG